MSVETTVSGSFGKKYVEDTIGERMVAAPHPQRLWKSCCKLVCMTLNDLLYIYRVLLGVNRVSGRRVFV